MLYDYSAAMRFWVNATNNDIFAGTLALSILNNGNIGIGNSDPGDKLVVDGTNVFTRVSNASTGDGGIKISYQNSNSHGLHLLYNPGSAIAYIDNTYPTSSGQVYGDIQFRQNINGSMTPRMVINTTTPSTALTVAGAISSSGATYVGGNLSVGTTYNGFAANISGTTYVIGASVWVNDGYGYANASSGGTGFFPSSSTAISINSGGNTRMFIASGSGNVGIGTTSPDTPLVVQGGATGTGGWNRTATLSATYPGLIFNSNGTKWGVS